MQKARRMFCAEGARVGLAAALLVGCAPETETGRTEADLDPDRHVCLPTAEGGVLQRLPEGQEPDPDRTVRYLPPGAMMTMDYHPDRLNVRTDETGAVRELFCG
ncbi:I78 family peptidase inhibitor [Roseivivax lentus]|nr:I78 family peptidase inhibitor [Roseivivax lentus]